MTASNFYIGIMSGTSLDGIDVALVKITDNQTQFVAGYSCAFSGELKTKLTKLVEEPMCHLADLGEISINLATEYANAVNTLLREQQISNSQITAIGCHGQTVFHAPNAATGFSWQLVNASVLAVATGISVVHNFREMDLALGGEGAPLVPLFHQSLISEQAQNWVFVNIGGIANISLVSERPLLGYDTGPGNTLIDLLTLQHYQLSYDKNGDFARAGKVCQQTLTTMLNDPYFSRKAPKSTGREYFNHAWLTRFNIDQLSPNDTLATVTELTATTIAHELTEKPAGHLVVCGGGSLNSFLLERLQVQLNNWQLVTADEVGLNSEFMEAMAFAWFAYRTLNHQVSSAKAVTGASRDALLGQITFIR
jgi:anhydro-N-acetylmuramic acid kinase